jgi:hypothetical protein
LHEKARKDFPHSPAGKPCSKTIWFSGSGDEKTVKNQWKLFFMVDGTIVAPAQVCSRH